MPILEVASRDLIIGELGAAEVVAAEEEDEEEEVVEWVEAERETGQSALKAMVLTPTRSRA